MVVQPFDSAVELFFNKIRAWLPEEKNNGQPAANN